MNPLRLWAAYLGQEKVPSVKWVSWVPPNLVVALIQKPGGSVLPSLGTPDQHPARRQTRLPVGINPPLGTIAMSLPYGDDKVNP